MSLLLALLAHALQSGTVEVPFKKGEYNMTVPAVVNGRPVNLLFDTGFSGTVVVNSSVDVGPTTGSQTLTDFVGHTDLKTVKLKSISVGGRSIPIETGEVVLQQDGDFSSDDNHVDGILGLAAFKSGAFTIDFQRSKFVFHPAAYDVSTRVPDNKTTFLAKLLPIGHVSLEMFVKTPEGKSMTMALDTGNANYATTHPDILERVGLWHQGKDVKFTHQSGIASGAVESFSVQMPELNIFGIPTPPTVWDVINLPSATAEGDGTVGFGFLKHFNITVDYPHRRVLFENYEPAIANDESADVGLSAATYPEKKRVIVYSVTPGGPAETAGIKRGDTVLSIDGEDLDRVSPQKFRSMMEGKAGTVVRIAYSHEGGLKRVELKRSLLVNETEKPAKTSG